MRLAQRAQIVLLAAQGLQNKNIAEQLGIERVQVARWRERFPPVQPNSSAKNPIYVRAWATKVPLFMRWWALPRG